MKRRRVNMLLDAGFRDLLFSKSRSAGMTMTDLSELIARQSNSSVFVVKQKKVNKKRNLLALESEDELLRMFQ